MTENGPPADHERTANSEDTPRSSGFSVTPSRRRLLQTLTSGGTLLLAGCGQDGASDIRTPTGTTTKRGTASSGVFNQTFSVPIDQNPARASFYALGMSRRGSALKSTFALTPKKPVSGRLGRFIWEPGVWVDKWWVGATTHYTWLEEPIEITPTEVTVTIRDDVRWSDGHPITGIDIALNPILEMLDRRFPPSFARENTKAPTRLLGALDGVNITDTSVTYRSSQGHFDQFWASTIRKRFGFWGNNAHGPAPTHIEPYTDFSDAVIGTARKAFQGEINPWKGWDDPRNQPDDPHKASLIATHLAKGGKYVAKFSNPEHVVSNSAWDLVALDGPEATFEPNSHHRNADAVNFDRVILEYTSSARRERTALKADRLDYATPGPTPQSIVDALPENITQLLIPGSLYTGNELGLNFNHPKLGKRAVRAALMYALNQSAIAKNIHPSTAVPIETPGGDCWDVTDYASQEWIDTNFITYNENRERAASLMRTAGYTRQGKQWVDSSGKQFTLTLATANGTPRWEPTVASQLSEFGIQTSVQTLNGTTFSKRVNNGEFPLWSHFGISTNMAPVILQFWFAPLRLPTKYGIYPRDQFETGAFSRGGLPQPRTEDRWSDFTIKAPPIGEPNGTVRTYSPSALALAFLQNPPKEQFQRRVKTGMWLANWFLPTIPINKTMQQHFIDDTHWQWPEGSPQWKTFTSGGPRRSGGIFTSGTIRANPDNT